MPRSNREKAVGAMTIGEMHLLSPTCPHESQPRQIDASSFERVAALASALFKAPVAMVALAEDEHPAFVAHAGIDTAHFNEAHDLCMMAMRRPGGLIIPDAAQDPTLADHPLVSGAPFIRFLAGLPIHAPDGRTLGALCVMDTCPRSYFSVVELENLEHLKALAEADIFRLLAPDIAENKMTERVTFIGELLDSLSKAADAQTVLDAAVRGVADVFKANTVTALSAPNGGSMRCSAVERRSGKLMDAPDAAVIAETVWRNFIEAVPAADADLQQAAKLLHDQLSRQCPAGHENAILAPLVAANSGCAGFLLVPRQTACSDARQAEALLTRFAELTSGALARVQGEEHTDYFRYLFDKNPNAMWIYDVETWAFLAVNEAAIRLYGYSEDVFLGMTIRDIRPLEDIPALEYTVSRHALQTNLRRSGEWRHITADGRLLDVEVDGFPIEFKGRRAVLVVCRDISARKQAERRIKDAEERLRQAEKLEAIGQLTGGIAHDFGNILTVILSNLELLEGDLPANPTVARRLASIRRAAESAGQMTQRLLTFARKHSHAPERTELTALVSRAAELLRQALPDSIEIKTNLPGEPVWAHVDSCQLDSAIINLAMNARDAMPDGGTLSIGIELTAADDASDQLIARIMVTDTGIGMPEHVLRHATEPFFTTKGAGRGTGLGLSMVYGFVTQAGGRFDISSVPGKGTTISMGFPADQQANADIEAEAVAADTISHLRVLVVEDDELVREAMEDMIKQLGCSVISVPGPQWALDLLASAEPIDVLMTDVVLSSFQKARDLIEIVELHRPRLPVIYCSGHPAHTLVAQELLPADAQLLSKPFTCESLRDALIRAMASAKQKSSAN